MKKLLYLLFAITLLGCGSDDDSSDSPLVGTWQLVSIKENGIPIHNECDLENNITLLEGNTGTYFEYYNWQNTKPCELIETYDLIWSNGTSDSKYNITIEGDISIFTLNGDTLEYSFENGSGVITTEEFRRN